MALIKYGPLADEVSGTVGGVTFARVRTGKTARTWRAPVDKRRPGQLSVRASFANASNRWFSILSAAQRTDWATYAATCPFTNPLGETYHLTGFNMYVRTQTWMLLFQDEYIAAAPTDTGFPSTYAFTFSLDQATGVLSWNTIDPAPPAGDDMLFRYGSLCRVTRQYPVLRPLGFDLIELDVALPHTIYTFPSVPLPVAAYATVLSFQIYDGQGRLAKPSLQLITSD